MIEAFLKSIGLSENEITLYILLLRIGTQPTSSLAKHAGMSRSTAYSSLQRLLSKGLVSEAHSKGTQYFSALETSQLEHYVEEHIRVWSERKEMAAEVTKRMDTLRNPLIQQPKVQVFSGREGAYLALCKTLTGNHKTIYAFTALSSLTQRLGEGVLEAYTQKRKQVKKRIRIIRTKQSYQFAKRKKAGVHLYEHNKKDLREVKYIPNTVKLSLGLYIAGSQIVIISSEKENYALCIQSKSLSDALQGMYDLLWQCLPTEDDGRE